MQLSDAERQQFRVEPTPEVIQAAEATILAHERAIASVEERVAHLLNQVQDLRYEQARHRAAIARCRGRVVATCFASLALWASCQRRKVASAWPTIWSML